RRLANEGLAVTRENRRTYVAEPNAREFRQIFDVLVMLEGYSAEQSAATITFKQLEQLRKLNAKMAKLDMDVLDDRVRFLDLNFQFHHLVHSASGNTRIADIIGSLIDFTRFLMVKHGEINREQAKKAIFEHNDIIKALEERNGSLAKLSMQLHREAIRSGFTRLWGDLETADGGDSGK
ncbi:MAG: GntR family transcriptional regulator, partial [Pseudomonadota bacterium]